MGETQVWSPSIICNSEDQTQGRIQQQVSPRNNANVPNLKQSL